MRASITMGLVGALCFCAVASAAKVTYHGRDLAHDQSCAIVIGGVPPPCVVDLHVHARHGRVKKIDDIAFRAIPASCDGGNDDFTDKPPPALGWHVNGARRFRGAFSFDQSAAKARFRGRFSKSFKKASGTLRITGTGTNAGLSNCDTGRNRYSVKRKR
jgi:type 1 fimbria pilin